MCLMKCSMFYYYCDRIMIMYVHQQYYIISEQVFVQTYEDIIWLVFFWCESLSAPTLRYHERTTSGRVTEPVVRDTQGCRNVLFTLMHWLPIPCLHDLTRNLFSQIWHQWHPMMSQYYVYLNPFTGIHSSALTRSLFSKCDGSRVSRRHRPKHTVHVVIIV